jgi:hypothetical protein
MLSLSLTLKCSCGVEKEVKITHSTKADFEALDLAGSIVNNSDGLFTCVHSGLNELELVCVTCGKDEILVV